MSEIKDDVQAVEKLGEARDGIVAELRKAIVGMNDVIDEMMIAIFAQGHCLLVGVPGLAKTLLVSSLAQTLSLSFKRIQFTPDLMPSDITGTELLQEDPETHARKFKFLAGPVFTNLLLADEINRTPPKTQAALLEAMQEKRISSVAWTTNSTSLSLFWPLRTRSSRKGPIRFRKRSSTVFCSISWSSIPAIAKRLILCAT